MSICPSSNLSAQNLFCILIYIYIAAEAFIVDIEDEIRLKVLTNSSLDIDRLVIIIENFNIYVHSLVV